MSKLAILGGEPIRKKPFASWPLFRPSDVERLVGVVESRHWGGFPLPGKLAGEFAARFAELHGAAYGLCLANGTIALLAAVQALGLKFGDEVIVPAYTWDGTAVAVLQAGGVPVFVDVDPDTYCLAAPAVRAAITPRTRAIMPVHLAMRFADMEALRAIARAHKLLIIEDCTHAHGGRFQGRGAGAGGDAGCFSFQESKLMTAGEGGIVLTSRLDYFEALQSIVNCGRPSLTDQYRQKVLGSNYRMTELQAALLLGQLEMLPELCGKRTRHAALLNQKIGQLPHVRPLPPQPGLTQETIYHYVFQYRPTGPAPGRDLFVAALEAEGIPCDGRFYEPVYQSELFHPTPENCPQLVVGRDQPMDYSQCHCPVSEKAAYEESVWLPQFLLIGDEADVRDVVGAIEKVVANLKELAGTDPKLAGLKAYSRPLRARAKQRESSVQDSERLPEVSSPAAWTPVKLTPYPQKFRTFYNLSDPNVPAELRAEASPLPDGQVAVRVSDGALWLGSAQGLLRLDFSAPERDRRQYFAGRRYLPDDQVEQLCADNHAGVWVRTSTGVSHIERRAMTLAQKADFFERRIRDRHDRYGLVADSHLTVAGDTSSNRLCDNDNDGLWTAMYAATECFRYAVAPSPEALANARKSIEAVLFLEEVAGRRGFPARSFVRKGDPVPGGEWHWTADGQVCWKADTSSDEVVGHFFMFSVAYDLLPDQDLKQRIAQTAKRMMDHILDNGYNLIDLDGQPTTWGWWSPEKLRTEPDERALNSLQLLSFLKIAAHITGEARYETEYEKVAWELQYADWITRLDEFRQELDYSDEELAMLPFYCVFQYEKDPRLLTAYRRALEAWWKNIQREANPLWTFIYLLGRPEAKVDLSAAAWTLYRMPMDLIKWNVRNSHRRDIVFAPAPDRFGLREAITLLPPDERRVMKWNDNPFVLDGGGDGHGEDDGTAFLLPYWMGRYHKFLLGQ